MTTREQQRERKRVYRARNRPRILAVQAAWRRRNPARCRAYRARIRAQRRARLRTSDHAYFAAQLAKRFCGRAKASAKRYGVAFDLTPADIVVPERCSVLGLRLRVGFGRPGPDSPTLVRLDLTQGFVRGNVRVISKQASWQRAPQQRTAAADGLRLLTEDQL
jgi:hypothetical protein